VTRYLLDTDTFSLYLGLHPPVVQAVARHVSQSDELAVAVITVEELWSGWAAVVAKARKPDELAKAYDRLTDTLNELRNWPVVSFPVSAVRRYADLKKQKLNVGANDLKIASIALETGAVVVTHNTRDFGRVAGLQVVDWAGP
jgi:tRNA(fMet)-specific endonuclease VapC